MRLGIASAKDSERGEGPKTLPKPENRRVIRERAPKSQEEGNSEDGRRMAEAEEGRKKLCLRIRSPSVSLRGYERRRCPRETVEIREGVNVVINIVVSTRQWVPVKLAVEISCE